MAPWNSARTKVQIRLSIQRLRTLQEKKHALAKKSRREIADLLLKNRVETARLRVEGLIGDDIYVELLELLELYAEKLQARFNLLDATTGTEPEPSISDAVCAIVYAAPRTELKELQNLREMLMHKYGRQFALTLLPTEAPPPTVPSRIISKLALYTPARELVDAYLWEIAKGYGVPWEPETVVEGETPSVMNRNDQATRSNDKDDDEGGGSGSGSDDEGGGGGGGDGVGEKKEAIAIEVDKDGKGDKDVKGRMNWIPTPPSALDKDQTSGTPGLSNPPPAEVGGPQQGGGKKKTEEEALAERFERLKNLR